MNLRQGLFRIWVVLSICWVGGVFYLQGDALCAAYYWRSPAEIKEELARWGSKEVQPYKVQSGVPTLIIDTGSGKTTDIWDSREKPVYPFWRTNNCFTWSNPPDHEVMANGGFLVDWSERWPFLGLLVLPPFVLPLALMFVMSIVTWIVRGFRRPT